MLRPAFLVVLALAVSSGQAQQVESRGVPASVLSPTSPGAAHGTPASVNSPIPANNRLFITPRRPRVPFGNPRVRHTRRDRNLVPVPIFIPAYPLAGDYGNPADPTTVAEQSDSGDAPAESAPADDAVREAYYRGARDALAQQRADSRYGEHYLDSREKSQPPAAKGKPQPKEAAPPEEEEAATNQEPVDSGPAAVFIFKDGHRLETQNYAIQGQTLFDFSDNHLTKIKLADLDLDATKKANDNLGINVKFPLATP